MRHAKEGPPLGSLVKGIRRLFDNGEYLESVKLVQRILRDTRLSPRDRRTLKNEKARALRNLGEIEQALDIHLQNTSEALTEADDFDLPWQLLCLGKILGKYLHRSSLFSSCLREADFRFRALLETEHHSATEHRLYKRYAINLDLSGGYYRDLALATPKFRDICISTYERACSYHDLARNSEGVSRAACHLAYAKSLFAVNDTELSTQERTQILRSCLREFEGALRPLLRSLTTPRGRPTRLSQLASIYTFLGNLNHAASLYERAIREAETIRDPRALILSLLGLGDLHAKRDQPTRSEACFAKAQEAAHRHRYLGFEREAILRRARVLLEDNEIYRALDHFSKYEELAQAEISEGRPGVREAVGVLREVAPDRIDKYILDGQREDYTSLVASLNKNSTSLRSLIEKYHQRQNFRFLSSIHSFYTSSMHHSLKNMLHDVKMACITIGQQINGEVDTRAKGDSSAAQQVDLDVISTQVNRITESIHSVNRRLKTERAYLQGTTPESRLVESIAVVAKRELGSGQVVDNSEHDIIFLDMSSELLESAALHLIENIKSAVNNNPPTPSTPYLVIESSATSPGAFCTIRLMNPGSNPERLPGKAEMATNPGDVVHGFTIAKWFFEQLLGLRCSFSVVDAGPSSLGCSTNCVTLSAPIPESANGQDGSLALYRLHTRSTAPNLGS